MKKTFNARTVGRSFTVFLILFSFIFTYLPVAASAATPWHGINPLREGVSYVINNEITLVSDFIIPNGTEVTINKGGKLIIAANTKLTLQGGLTIEPGSEFDINGEFEIDVEGIANVKGTLFVAVGGKMISYGELIIEAKGGIVNGGDVTITEGSSYTKNGLVASVPGAVFRNNIIKYTPTVKPPRLPNEIMTSAILKNEPRTELLGIDVSHWQDKIEWDKVAASGVKFAIIRAARGHHSDEYPMREDTRFRENIEGAIKNGIDVGVYFYSYAHTPEEARIEARFFLDVIKSYKITYPVVFDVEEDFHKAMSKERLSELTEAFMEVIMDGGYYPMLYSNKTFLENKFEKQVVDTYAIWLALWSTTLTYDGPYYIWQYTATGKINGITGDVDLNVSYIDFPSVLRKYGLNNLR
ncbi:MAG: glycoside hydrolase family 25 protein [Oscillospiraceae bacterium]|nr:glycoside hydrolase family 25 protein [Oscillospiraceae bacterium]